MQLNRLLEKYSAGHAVIETAEIRFDPAFRAACEQNACGFYGACWMCPPDVGEIDALIARAKSYENALVFQTVQEIADSFDIEGMQHAARAHNRLISRIRRAAEKDGISCWLLGAGACGGCKTCAKQSGEPCRHPGRAVVSLEAAGVDVVDLAKQSGLPYMNGKNTVTYFGLLLFHGAWND
jgi:predicted metal-binding protein